MIMATGQNIIGAEALERRLTLLTEGIVDERTLSEIGEFLQFSIIERVQNRGEDVYGDFFEEYSPSYAAWRRKEGYQTGFVDLTVTGSMFDALTYEVYGDEVHLFFLPGTGRGSNTPNPAKAFYLQQDREFFGMTDEDVEEIVDLYNLHIGELMR